VLSTTLVGADGAVAGAGGVPHNEVLLVVGTGASAPDPSASRPGDMVSDEGSPVSSPPLYLDGGRRIAVATFGPGRPTPSVSFTPGPGAVFVKAFGGCTGDSMPHGHAHLLATLNGVTIDDTQCSQSGTSSVAIASSGSGPAGVDNPDSDYTTIDVHPGKSSTLGVTARVSPASTPVPTGSYAVYERIPFSQMPLPPAPAHLRLPPAGRNPILLDARSTAPTGTWYITARVGATLELVRAAPGELTVSYQGMPLGEAVGYDWQAGSETVSLDSDALGCGCGGRPPLGDTVRLTVHASGFTRAGWYVLDHVRPDPVPSVAVTLLCPDDGSPCRPLQPAA
jgi:hypothetical protein